MKYLLLASFLVSFVINAQTNQKLYDIIETVSEEHIESDIKTLANFGTRNTFSDTISNTRGIGAARRWIKSEFETISKDCKNCLSVFYHKDFVAKKDNKRVPHDAWIVNVVAIQKGTKYPTRYIIMSGDVDSRANNTMDFTKDAPGANDNTSGMAGTIETARVLSKYKFESSIIYVGLSGEEQGFFGGAGLAKYAKDNDWDIIGILNNDMIGNITGVDGIVEPSVKFKWDKIDGAKGYKIYCRDTTSQTWYYSRYVGDVSEFTLNDIVIDNFFFGIASIGREGFESLAVFPHKTFR